MIIITDELIDLAKTNGAMDRGTRLIGTWKSSQKKVRVNLLSFNRVINSRYADQAYTTSRHMHYTENLEIMLCP